MTDRIFDANALLETYRNALAPAFQAQQEGVKALERLARYQFAVAGDYLDWTLTQAKAIVAAKNPAELAAKQTELGTKISEQLRGRVQELTTIASESHSTLTAMFNAASAKAVELTKKAA
jgi:phasin family protein